MPFGRSFYSPASIPASVFGPRVGGDILQLQASSDSGTPWIYRAGIFTDIYCALVDCGNLQEAISEAFAEVMAVAGGLSIFSDMRQYTKDLAKAQAKYERLMERYTQCCVSG